jgi:hypothetical protein
MTAEWFYARNGQMAGPLTAQQLRQDALAGKVTASDHVRRGANGAWVSAANVKGLFDPAPTPPKPALPPAPVNRTAAASVAVVAKEKKLAYKVLTQKDKWLSRKFDPESLEQALNSYGQQGWRVRTGDAASFPGFLTSDREELITILERDEASGLMEIYEYKVLTQKDKWYSGKFDPERLEGALNAYAQQGWNVVFGTSASFPGFFSSNREELIVVLSRKKSP